MDRHTCGGELLPLPPEIVTHVGVEATFLLAACMSCGSIERSQAGFSFTTP